MANPNGWQIAEQIDELPARPVRPSAHFHPALRTAGEIMAERRQVAVAGIVVDLRSTVLVVVASD